MKVRRKLFHKKNLSKTSIYLKTLKKESSLILKKFTHHSTVTTFYSEGNFTQ